MMLSRRLVSAAGFAAKRASSARIANLLCARGIATEAALSPTDEPYDFVKKMKEHNIRRGFIRYLPEEGLLASHDCFQPLAQMLSVDSRDFLEHEAIFFEIGEKSDAFMAAFLWWTYRGQGCGGIRLREYPTVEELVRDGMRLSLGMGRKSALAGLWWGGGKGVIAADPKKDLSDETYRKDIFEDYGKFITSLRGAYVAAEDSGVTAKDMDHVYAATRYTTCISPEIGGSGNPSVPTAAGVVCAMEAALEFGGLGTLEGKVVAVQGIGNVGVHLVEFLLEKGVTRVIASDISPERVEYAKNRLSSDAVTIKLAPPGDNSILAEECDIVSPCGWGEVLNSQTIPKIRAKVICGAANNQLADPTGDAGILERGIIYVPDFVANRMGIVNCANEQYGRVGPLASVDDPAIARHMDRTWENSIYQTAMVVLNTAKTGGITPAQAGNKLADIVAKIQHPLWGHRSKSIIDSVIDDGWADL